MSCYFYKEYRDTVFSHLSSFVDDGKDSKWVLVKARGYHKTEDRKELCVRPCLNVQIKSVHKICRQNLSKIKLCDWPNKLGTTSWQVLNTTESVGRTDSK